MSKLTANNSFNGGLISDLSVFNTPADSVVDALNMELVTVDKDQYLYQNIRGNKKIVDLGKYTENNIDYNFIPLGVEVYDDIAYILAGAFDASGNFIAGTIGTFPSPDWSRLNDPNDGTSMLSAEFRSLHNFKANKNVPGEYTEPFISKEFKFIKNKHIDIIVQGDFDRSANIIFTDGANTTKIINSRFKSTDIYGLVELADRRGSKDSNIYNDTDWDRIDLIQISDIPIKVKDFRVSEGGSLRGGGYIYFFKYTTQEGNTTDILYESPLIPISDGVLGLNKEQISNKYIEFELEGLDSSYTGIQVYFAHFDGYPEAESDFFKINYIFTYKDGKAIIKHSGLESVTPVDVDEISKTFSPVDTVQSIDSINDRIALANVSSTMTEEDIKIMENAAKNITIWESTKILNNESYSDPNIAAKYLGYWPGEVYELAVVWLLKSKGLSPAFPLTGMDNIDGEQSNFGNDYPAYTLGPEGFSTDGRLINNKGLFRVSNKGKIYTPRCEEEGDRHVRFLKAKTDSIANDQDLLGIVSGFFIVRRERIKNVLMQGMMVPTLKLPATKPGISPRVTDSSTTSSKDKADFLGNTRYLMRYYIDNRTIGLNAPYKALYRTGTTPIFDVDFSTIYVPQLSNNIQFLTTSSSADVWGSVGQTIGSGVFGEDIDNEGNKTGSEYLAFYSCELDINLPRINNLLTGSSPSIEIQRRSGLSPLTATGFISGEEAGKDKKPTGEYSYIFKNIQDIDLRNGSSDFINIHSKDLKTTLVNSGSEITAKGSFSGKIDRSLGLLSFVPISKTVVTYDSFSNRVDPNTNYLSPSAIHDPTNNSEIFQDGARYRPFSILSQSYSIYLGVKIDTENIPEIPTLNYLTDRTKTTDFSVSGENFIVCTKWGQYVSTVGQLANVFRGSTGRWDQSEIIDIYKYDNNKPYFSVTDRLDTSIQETDIFQGDAFISKFYKRTTYKNGVGLLTASSGDAGTFGVGFNRELNNDFDEENIPTSFSKDKGRNLYDVGQIAEIVSYSNINADIRSTEFVSKEETKAIGYDRDFFPHKDESIIGDLRPDSIFYNQGYSPNNKVISYFRIEENAAVFSTEFPNRVMLSEKNQTQEFYNSFRDLRGFNFRDYGLEYGPIVKIITVESMLLSIHRKGVLAIAVDDRTLLAEGSDIYVDTAKALSPKAAVMSSLYGTIHQESVVKSDATIIGVDYNADAIWMYVGGKIKVISEFAVKTVLKRFKKAINEGGFGGENDTTIYRSRVYSTFNHTKHTLYVSYIAEHPVTKDQYHVGTLTYNTVINKWMSRISEGNKFSMRIASNTFTFGFSDISNIWEEDALIDPVTGKYLRSMIRDVSYYTEFEIIINEKPTYEKILENIIVLCNKRIPTELVFTTSGDVNDPALDIWGQSAASTETVQPIMTRGDSLRKNIGLGILDQNAYYRTSKLYIEVGKVKTSIKAVNNKRIRDKHIRVRFKYDGTDELFIQAIISILSISQ